MFRLHFEELCTFFGGESLHAWSLHDPEREASCMGLCVGSILSMLISLQINPDWNPQGA